MDLKIIENLVESGLFCLFCTPPNRHTSVLTLFYDILKVPMSTIDYSIYWMMGTF